MLLHKYQILAAFIAWYSGKSKRPTKQIVAKLRSIRQAKPWLAHWLELSELAKSDVEFENFREMLNDGWLFT